MFVVCSLQLQCVERVLVSVVYDQKPELAITHADGLAVEAEFLEVSSASSVIALEVGAQFVLSYTCSGQAAQSKTFTVSPTVPTEVSLKCVVIAEKRVHTVALKIDEQGPATEGFTSVEGEVHKEDMMNFYMKYGELCVGVLNGSAEYKVCSSDRILRRWGSGEAVQAGEVSLENYVVSGTRLELKVTVVAGPESVTLFPVVETPRVRHRYFAQENAQMLFSWFQGLSVFYDNSTVEAPRDGPNQFVVPARGYTGVLGRLTFGQAPEKFEEHVLNNVSLSLMTLKNMAQRPHQFVGFSLHKIGNEIKHFSVVGDFVPGQPLDLDNIFSMTFSNSDILTQESTAYFKTLPQIMIVSHAHTRIFAEYQTYHTIIGPAVEVLDSITAVTANSFICDWETFAYFSESKLRVLDQDFFFSVPEQPFYLNQAGFDEANCGI